MQKPIGRVIRRHPTHSGNSLSIGPNPPGTPAPITAMIGLDTRKSTKHIRIGRLNFERYRFLRSAKRVTIGTEQQHTRKAVGDRVNLIDRRTSCISQEKRGVLDRMVVVVAFFLFVGVISLKKEHAESELRYPDRGRFIREKALE